MVVNKRDRNLYRAVVVFTVIVASSCSLLLQPCHAEEDMPDMLSHGSSPELYPQFIAASLGVRPDGTPTELLDASTRRAIKTYLAQPFSEQEGCVAVNWWNSADSARPGNSTFANSALNADVVLLGEVTGLRPGFFGDRIGTLIRLEPVSLLKGTTPHQEHFVFIPVGTFNIGPHKVCKLNDSWPRLPEEGEQMLVLYRSFQIEESSFTGLHPDSLAVLGPEGVHLGSVYDADPVRGSGESSESFLDSLSETIATEEAQ